MKLYLLLVAMSLPAAWVFGRAAQDPELAEPSLADLAWMSGTWEAEVGGLRMEEHWTQPRGHTLLGLHRDVHLARDATVSFEFLRIVEDKHGIRYLASPGGRAPTPFALETLTEGEVTFANPEHDFPKRIVYTLLEKGTVLRARIEGDGGRSQEWSWKKVR